MLPATTTLDIDVCCTLTHFLKTPNSLSEGLWSFFSQKYTTQFDTFDTHGMSPCGGFSSVNNTQQLGVNISKYGVVYYVI